MLTRSQQFAKRSFDIVVSIVALSITWWIIAIAYIIASLETRSNGFFIQTRIGKNGHPFSLIKIKTMQPLINYSTTITASNDPRITKFGAFFRQTKIDELPQLFNVLLGSMSLVGPRPDVSGYADKLNGEDTLILTLRPGITGPATLKYKNEEELLASQVEPKRYNDEIIWPDKININRKYLNEWSFWGDIHYLWSTLKS
jgi:lipopolysaccharide/colanic/teichoic acid biosynthesis glycosyltransferase